MKNVGNSSRGRSQRVPKIFRAPMYSAHCAVIFAIAQQLLVSLGSQISEVTQPIAAKLCHMIAIRRQSLAKVGQLGGPPLKNFSRDNFKSGFKFSVLATITSGLVGVSSQNIFHRTCPEAGS